MAPPVTPWLLPLTLLLHAAGGSTPFRRPRRPAAVALGGTVELGCEAAGKHGPSGGSWLFQPPGDGAVPAFITYLSASSPRGRWAPGRSARFSGALVGTGFSLTVRGFLAEDQGYYFCSFLHNGSAFFSPFVPVFLPGPGAGWRLPSAPMVGAGRPTQTRSRVLDGEQARRSRLHLGVLVRSRGTLVSGMPTLAAPHPVDPAAKPAPRPPTSAPPATSTWHPVSARPEICGPRAGGAADARRLDFACHAHIWAPLAGICGLLLLSLLVTVACCHRNRRRVCKCPRPVVRQGGKAQPF
ncbi:T-cell surface glycoprotein CD8 alpha chain [Perognathus longimembris pacificus]|uniref:T-cell surface glycoprotein CD8 alpha chain n=1 Tax=Perognathus longimembris pacificus TaxID=214514 RepID=UPI002018CC89|nr:T-cell surface glycoprotein CD8 alpha chain [Perognathus longimembris pacificus]